MRLRFFAAALLLLTSAAATAQRLPRTVFPVHYDLTFAPDFAKETFDGEETIEVTNELATTSIKMNAMDITFHDVTINDQKATVAEDKANEEVMFTVANPIAIGPATIHVRYTGILNKDLKGLYLGETGGRKYASTQFEAAAARFAFPSFDEPEMKATFTVTAIADEGDLAISNGSVVSESSANGKHTFHFSTTPRMSSYLVALTVGPFDCLKDEVDGIPLRVCATRDKVANTRFALESTKAIVSFFNRYYGTRYAFTKLDQVAVPDFAAGAMENTADIIYRETALLVSDNDAIDRKKGVASVISHEIAHQWFGDLVTMKWWNDIWLNEGFATFMAPKPLKVWKPDWEFGAGEVIDNRGTLGTDSLVATRAIRTDIANAAQAENSFDAIAYGKTAWVLRMAESYIGEEAFRAGVNAYIAANAYANTSAEDFTGAMDRASSKPVAEVISSFIRQPGLPLVSVKSSCDAGTTTLTLSQQRFFSDPMAASKSSPEQWLIPICFRDQCELLREKTQTYHVKGCDPIYLNRGARGYYLLQYEPQETLRLATSSSMQSFEKFALLRDEWTLTRAGRRDVGDFLRLANALRNDRDPRVLQQLTTAFETIGERFTTPESDAAFRKWVADYLRPVAAELGWAPKPGESPLTGDLRGWVQQSLGYTGHDRATLDKANELAKKWITDRRAVDPSMTEVVLTLAAVRADPKVYDRLRQAYDKSNDPQEQRDLRSTIAKFSDPKLALRTLDWSTTPGVRSQDAGGVMSAVLGVPEMQSTTWKYFIANWDRFAEKLPRATTGGGRGGPITALASLCDPQLRDEAAAAMKAHAAAGTERRIAQSLERSGQCIATREMQAPKLSAWAKNAM